MNIKIQLINETTDIIKPLIGYEYSSSIVEMVHLILKYVGSIIGCNEFETQNVFEQFKEILAITKYSDYLLVSNEKYGLKHLNFDIFKQYFQCLEKKDNIEKYYDEEEFTNTLNHDAMLGNYEAIKLKAYLFSIETCGYQCRMSAIPLFKECLYYGNLFSLKSLVILDSSSKDYYEEMYRCLDIIFNESLFNIDHLKFSKRVLDDCKILTLCYQKQRQSKLIDHELMNYVFYSKDNAETKMKIIRNDLYHNTNNLKKDKIGFKRGI